MPLLRRSSTVWSSSTTLSRRNSENCLSLGPQVNDYDHCNPKLEDENGQSLPEFQWLSPCRNYVVQTIQHQLQGMTEDFVKSGLPWSGNQCRSFMAGGTGILYCLPAMAIALAAWHADHEGHTGFHASPVSIHHNLQYLEQAAWILQAYLSVMADYVHIHHDSVFHGLDRYYASFNTIVTLVRAALVLSTMIMLALGSPPICCFVLANRAKTMAASDLEKDHYYHLQQWHWWHGAWHVTGSIAVAVAVYWMYSDQ